MAPLAAEIIAWYAFSLAGPFVLAFFASRELADKRLQNRALILGTVGGFITTVTVTALLYCLTRSIGSLLAGDFAGLCVAILPSGYYKWNEQSDSQEPPPAKCPNGGEI